jgi:hypothetical protein
VKLRLREDRLPWVELEGEVVALDEAALTYLSANESGALLWRELSRGATRDELARRLAAEFELETARAEADVDRFLTDLRERGLLEDA